MRAQQLPKSKDDMAELSRDCCVTLARLTGFAKSISGSVGRGGGGRAAILCILLVSRRLQST